MALAALAVIAIAVLAWAASRHTSSGSPGGESFAAPPNAQPLAAPEMIGNASRLGAPGVALDQDFKPIADGFLATYQTPPSLPSTYLNFVAARFASAPDAQADVQKWIDKQQATPGNNAVSKPRDGTEYACFIGSDSTICYWFSGTVAFTLSAQMRAANAPTTARGTPLDVDTLINWAIQAQAATPT